MFRLLSAKVAAVTVGGLAAAAGGGFALADAIGGPVSSSTQKAAALDRLRSIATTDSNTAQAPVPSSAPHGIRAQMLGGDAPVPIAPSVLQPQNGWLVSDGRTLVAVYAGAAGNEPSIGRVVIVRQDLAAGKQTVRSVDAGRTGALTISAAPLGAEVEASALRASLRLRTPAGRILTLDLGTGKVGGG
ncbi:MAG TPA: hypothetical protein VKO84_09425 [Gaiellaceae bacterium]|nr:hypothetical protein [Gaiellaceae bacterium]